jgi:hypothetical protein
MVDLPLTMAVDTEGRARASGAAGLAVGLAAGAGVLGGGGTMAGTFASSLGAAAAAGFGASIVTDFLRSSGLGASGALVVLADRDGLRTSAFGAAAAVGAAVAGAAEVFCTWLVSGLGATGGWGALLGAPCSNEEIFKYELLRRPNHFWDIVVR